MLGLGIWASTQDTEYKHLTGNLYVTITYISVASFIFITGFLGACAIVTLKQGLLKVYFGFVFTLFLAELAIAIYIYLERDKIPGFIQSNWNSTTDSTRILIQDKLKCCSFQPVITMHPSSDDVSCFVDKDKTNSRLKDCYNVLRDWVDTNYIILATCSTLVASIEMFVLAGTCRLITNIETGDTLIKQTRVMPFNPEMSAVSGSNKRKSHRLAGQKQEIREVDEDDIEEISLGESDKRTAAVLQSMNTVERKKWAKHNKRYKSVFSQD